MIMTVDHDEKTIEIEVEYDVVGYDPGNTCGPPDHCYPPEGEVEINNITILKIDGVDANLTLEESKELEKVIEENHSEKIDEKCWESFEPWND